jgi:hypothetical protein
VADNVRDPVAAAVDKVEQDNARPAVVKMHQIQVNLDRSGGRPVVMAVPVDMTDAERLELAAWITAPMEGVSGEAGGTLAGLLASASPETQTKTPSGLHIVRRALGRES